MGMGVPLLNEYKRSFLFKRIPQTALGGLKLRLGYDAPSYVYFNQIVLWLVPLLLGCVFTAILELAYTDEDISDFLLLYSCLYGACIIIFVVVVQTISTVVEMKEKESLEQEAALGSKGGISKAQKKFNNLLADEDEIEFESCCGSDTLVFVAPPKKFKINIAIHALLSGIVCGVGFWYLLPYTINKLYGHSYGATATLFILGWFTISIAQYSLTTAAPPEPAIYRTMDAVEVLPLTRPLYTCICYAVHIANWYNSDFQQADQVLHVVFVTLPLLWLVGLLPPAEVLLLWLLEQGHVWLLGGSPAASTPRFIVNLGLSMATFFTCYLLGSTFASVVLAAGAGYLLSCDLGSLGSQIWRLCHRNNNRVSTRKPSQLTLTLSSPHPKNTGFLWSWCLTTCLYHAVMTAASAAAAGAAVNRAKTLSDLWKPVGYAVMGLCVVEKLLRDSQSVYVMFGLWRNWLYPSDVEDVRDFKKSKSCLQVLGVMRRCLTIWVCPLVMVFYLGLLSGANIDAMDVSLRSGKSKFTAICYILGIVRALRWSWQSTTHALLEVSVIHIILVMKPPGWDDLEFSVLLLLASFARDRFFQIANKLFFWLAVVVSSWTDKKQRRRSTAPIIVLNLIFFPILLSIVTIASVLFAPLLCVFTLPLFFIGFPRPSRFWSEPVGASASTCPDTLYYRQLSTELAKSLRSAFANGSLGEPQVGNHYLCRFQDRLVWVMVLERGTAFATVSIKGLELQETSCHTAEAARIDDQFTEAFTRSSGSCNSINQYPLHCLTPLDVAHVQTYSDAKNILTGVIDMPGGVETTLGFFTKSLVWLLLHHVNQRKKREAEARRRKEKEIAEMEGSSESGGGGDWGDKSDGKHTPPLELGKGSMKRKDKVSMTGPNKGNLVRHKNSLTGGLNINMPGRFGSSHPKKGSGGVIVRPPPPPFGEPSSMTSVMSSLPPIIPGNRTSLVHTYQHQPQIPPMPPMRPGSGDSKTSSHPRSYSPASLQSYTDIFSDEEEGGGGDRGLAAKRKIRLNLAQQSSQNKEKKNQQQEQNHEMSTIVTITHTHPNPLPSSPTGGTLTSLPPIFKPAVVKKVTSHGDANANLDDSSSGREDLDDLMSDSDFGLPAVDVNAPRTRPPLGFGDSPSPPTFGPSGGISVGKPSRNKTAPPFSFPSVPASKLNGNHIFKPVMNLAGSPDFKCQYSTHISIPHKWRELPIEPSQLSRYLPQFPTAWYHHVLATLDWSGIGDCNNSSGGGEVVQQVAQDDTLTNCYSQLIMACFLAFDSSGYHSGANYLYKCYNGDVPWNAMMDWLSEDKELHSLVIKAFRYSFKLMLDQTLLGDISDGEELQDCLTTLDREWYIGREADLEWGAAVVEGKQNLFSLGYSQAQGVYTSRNLSLQELAVSVGRVNKEAVLGQWANLNLELLYMTNDDEERYSIQAQPALLRNLTVQAADPPLGYPIYSSPPISVPTL